METTIHNTKDYKVFATINGNRNVNKKKIQQIKDDIKNGLNLLPYVPIIVYEENNQYYIVDGQHRFNVSVELKEPVYYVVSEKLSLQQMARINSRQDKWTMSDFLRCYVKIGIEDYKQVEMLMKIYNVGVSTAVDLLMNGKISKKGDNSLKFKNGDFKVNFYDETIELLTLSHSLFDRYKFFTDRNLITAVQELKKKGLCDFEILRNKLKENPNLLDQQGSTKDYIFNIERIYNHKNQKRVVIF